MKQRPRVERLERRDCPDAVPIALIVGPYANGYYPTAYQHDPEITAPDLADETVPDYNDWTQIRIAVGQNPNIDQVDPWPDPNGTDPVGVDQAPYSPQANPDLFGSGDTPTLWDNAALDFDQGVVQPISEQPTDPSVAFVQDQGTNLAQRVAVRDMMDNIQNWAQTRCVEAEQRLADWASLRDTLRANGLLNEAYRANLEAAACAAEQQAWADVAVFARRVRNMPLNQIVDAANAEYADSSRAAQRLEAAAATANATAQRMPSTLYQARVATASALPWSLYTRQLAGRLEQIQAAYPPP